ncbi:DUF3016 domain-containing protein [Rhodanobacter sp. DHG33]|uniref:DUF3016 domain-containing protein n=1 Tax=Rhodanobacter sp. DHG33 TaxID=2775921 RepID=UPI00177BDD5A|nr:DUF3016 domain-containing protein [Rhodanobacter sp. DHG33]MBD8899553.1 DUF3016 domain-containing protein [Rhodanobacter sp. DHG33]
MNRRIVLHVLLAALALLGAPAMAADAAPTNVTVTYDHPEQFTETKKVRALSPRLDDDSYLKTLKSYTEVRAGKMLPPGERLDIVITDIDRAGNFEPWRPYPMRDVRIVKDIYPPRIDLHFQLLDASGKVIREGARKLRDPGFMYDGLAMPGNDTLRYEKGLIDRWLRKGPDQL